jgi:hypothetical protein
VSPCRRAIRITIMLRSYRLVHARCFSHGLDKAKGSMHRSDEIGGVCMVSLTRGLEVDDNFRDYRLILQAANRPRLVGQNFPMTHLTQPKAYMQGEKTSVRRINVDDRESAPQKCGH